MNVEGVEGKHGVFVHEAIQVNVGDDEARRAAVCILEDPLHVAAYGDGGATQAVEDGHFLSIRQGENDVVRFRHSFKKGRHQSYHLCHNLWPLQLCH